MKDPVPGGNNAEATLETMARKIEELEAENRRLQAENARLQEQNERLNELSTHDTLTGILNRRGAEELIELIKANGEVSEEKREKKIAKRKLSFLFLDIDNFKSINDTYGHDAGDAVLKKTAEFIKTAMRKYDIVARWGGEEFLVVFQDIDAQRAINKFFNEEYRAEKYKGLDESKNKPQISFAVEIETKEGKKEVITVTLSGGVTDYKYGESTEVAMKRADAALYASKKAGRNMITKYEEPPKAQ